MTKQLLIIMVRNPTEGKVKTRLAATMGEARALKIYHKLLEFTKGVTKDLMFDKVVFYTDFIDTNDLWDQSIYKKRLQPPGDLGEKIQAAFSWGFEKDYDEICIIGSDCYELTPDIIINGFDLLQTKDAVLGPTYDGGYYLLGLKSLKTVLFQNKKWGTDSVAAETIADFKRLGLDFCKLKILNDVDVESDLPDALKSE